MNNLDTITLTLPQQIEQTTSVVHAFMPARQIDSIESKAQKKCNICLDEIGMSQKISKLPCKHTYHNECIQSYLFQTQICPTCRETIEEKVAEYENLEAMHKSELNKIPQKCNNDFCHLWVSNNEVNLQESLCPYPVSSFKNYNLSKFVSGNVDFLMFFLYEQFFQKGIKIIANFDSNNLTLVISHRKKIEKYYYSDNDITGNNVKECFTVFIRKLRVDTMFFFLKAMYPNMFAKKSEVYIASYNCKDDILSLKIDDTEKSIKLTQVFQSENKQLNWNILRELITVNNYKRLFEPSKIKHEYKDGFVQHSIADQTHSQRTIHHIFSRAFGGLSSRSPNLLGDGYQQAIHPMGGGTALGYRSPHRIDDLLGGGSQQAIHPTAGTALGYRSFSRSDSLDGGYGSHNVSFGGLPNRLTSGESTTPTNSNQLVCDGPLTASMNDEKSPNPSNALGFQTDSRYGYHNNLSLGILNNRLANDEATAINRNQLFLNEEAIDISDNSDDNEMLLPQEDIQYFYDLIP